jgi:hypothetical protein
MEKQQYATLGTLSSYQNVSKGPAHDYYSIWFNVTAISKLRWSKNGVKLHTHENN